MEYSSSESQQQQPQQQQHQWPQEQHQPYDLAQSHLHDPYHGYHQQRSYDAAAAHDQYYYHYYHPPEHAASQQRPVAGLRDSSATTSVLRDTSQGIQHRGGSASAVPGDAQDQRGPYPAPPRLNPAAAAAVAALSELVQLAGTMDAAERTGACAQERWQQGLADPGMRNHMVPPPQHPYEYPTQAGGMRQGVWNVGGHATKRFTGRRGKTRGRSNGFGHHPQWSGGRAPFRGRGRGARTARVGYKQSHQLAPELQSDSVATESITEPQSAETQVQGPAPMVPQQPIVPHAWCDICRVGCNSLDILEQHKNGKRHKRTVQRLEEIRSQQNFLAESQAQPCMQGFDERQTLQQESQEKVSKPANGVFQEAKVNNIVQVGEEIKPSAISESLQEASTKEQINKTESKVQSVAEQSEGAKGDGDERKNPVKRKMTKFRRVGKRLRTSESMRRKQARLKEQPRICTLCNVICETLVVFDSHIAGKKHSSRIKRFQGQAVYGPLNVYIAPNQPSIHDPSGPQPLYFGLQTHEMAPLTGCGTQLLLLETHESYQTVPMPQILHPGAPEGMGDQNAVSASEVKKDSMAARMVPSNTATETEDAAEEETPSATNKGLPEAEGVITAEDTIAAAEASFMNGEDISTADCGVVSAENVIPGLDIEVQESSAKNETDNHDTSSH